MKKKPAAKMVPIGELALIDQIRGDFATTRSKGPGGVLALGIGDDCAILRPPRGYEVLVTTDFTLEGPHFDRKLHPPESVGHRCLARGLSDLAAMGAIPMAAFLSLALPAKLLSEASGRLWITRFFNGLRSLAELHGVPLAGGDTSESPRESTGSSGLPGLILADIVLVGSAPRGKALRRSGGSAGDLVYVTGHLGGAAAELSTLQRREARVVKVTTTDDHPQLFPEPRIDAGEALLRRHLATASIDLSDGLSTDLAHLCRASGVNAEVEQDALPIHPLARKLGAGAALDAALHGGEDYELLFAAPASVQMPNSLAGVPVTRIGRLTRRAPRHPLIMLIKPDGTRVPLETGGWEHFSSVEAPKHKSTRRLVKKTRKKAST
jgi:thiamine-monophosphate kinase